MFNTILRNHLLQHAGSSQPPADWAQFLEGISNSFDHYEEQAKSMRRELDLYKSEVEQLKGKLLNETADLKNAHAELSRIFNHVNEGFFTRDLATNQYLHLSVGCEKIYGYSIEDFYANNNLWYEVIYDDDRILLEQDQELLARGEHFKNTYRIIHKDGSIRWIEVKAIPTVVDGRSIRVDGVVNDITERKEAEQAVIDSEAKYRSFFENNLDGILLGVPGVGIIEVNPAACEIFKASAEEICNYSLQQLLDFGNTGLVDLLEERKLTGSFKGEVKARRSDGSKFTAEISSSLFKDAKGNDRSCIIVRDITARQEAAAALLMSEQQLDLIYNTVGDSIFLIDVAGDRYKFISVNQSFLTTTGLLKEQVLNRFVEEVIPEPALTSVLKKYQEAIDEKKAVQWEERSVYPAGYRTGIVNITPVMDQVGNCIRMIGSIRDITDQVKAEEEFRASEQNFQSLVNTIDGIVWEADAETMKFIFVSQQAEILLGYPVADWINDDQFWQEHLHPADKEATVAAGLKYTKEKRSHVLEYRMIAANGRSLWFQDNVSVVTNEEGDCYLRGVMVEISERKKAEKIIRDSQERIRMIMSAALDAIVCMDTSDTITFWNPQAEKIFGWTEAEVRGTSLSNLIIPERFREMHVQGMQKYLQSGHGPALNVLLELSAINRQGEEFPVEITVLPIKQGGEEFFCAFIRDISSRKRAEKQITDSERRYRHLFEQNLAGVYQTRAAGEIINCNNAFADMLGYSNAAELLHSNISELYYIKSDKQKSNLSLQQHGRLHNYEVILKTQQGKALHVIQNISLFKDPDTGEELYDGIMIDITERKMTEARLTDSERRYRQIVETAQEGIWMVDMGFSTIFVNKKMCELLEYPEDEMWGKHITSFMKEVDKTLMVEHMERIRRGVAENIDLPFITRHGRLIWVNLSASSIHNSQGQFTGSLAMVTDITKRKIDEGLIKQSEASLDRKNKELQQKNRELEQFAYVASHDLQEPLRTTSSFVQLLQKQYEGKLDEKADKYLRFIVESSDRMKVLINDLLDYSRIGNKHQMEEVDCNKVMADVIADLDKAIAESGAHIAVGLLPFISGYPTEIKQLFQNLTINAIKFRTPGVVPQISIAAELSGDHWHFSFTDNGIGIDEVHNERIFVIFQRLHTRTEYQGSGIGLSHCKKIVELHHGKIWVESAPGIGSTFYFSIPIANAYLVE